MAVGDDLFVGKVVGVGPGARPIYEAQIGGRLYRTLIEDGHGGILGLGALPAHAMVLNAFGTPLAPVVAGNYGTLSDAYDDSTHTVWISDPAATDTNPAPTFEAWCTAGGGQYTHL